MPNGFWILLIIALCAGLSVDGFIKENYPATVFFGIISAGITMMSLIKHLDGQAKDRDFY